MVRTCYPASMDIVLSHATALDFWRLKRYSSLACVRPRGLSNLPQRGPSDEDVDMIKVRVGWVFETPLHVLVSSSGNRARGKHVACHVCGAPLPEGSLVKVTDGIYVCSPELCFQQLASACSFPKLVEVGFEFCGSYSRYPRRTGFYKRVPLANVNAMSLFFKRMSGTKGNVVATKALRYVIDGSWSPMEAAMVMLLCFPISKGGYGLPKPLMNHRINVPPNARRLTTKKFFVCDAYWPTAKLDVEYDSNEHHLKRKEKANDSARLNALSAMGISVCVVTWDQMAVRSSMDEVASSIARRLGKRLHLERLRNSRAQFELRQELLNFADPRTLAP